MVGHLTVPGLTERGRPASLSPRALRYLRAHAGSDTLIITDSLGMAAASSSLRIAPEQACVRALRAGADVALAVDANPRAAIGAIREAIGSGALPRA